MLGLHLAHTGSSVAKYILSDFDSALQSIVKVFPRDFKKALHAKKTAQQKQTMP
jgi:glutamate synthase (NADPH/NADH) large chain